MRPEEAALELGGLLERLCVFDPERRRQAVEELAARGEERAAFLLRDLMGHPDEVISNAAGAGLRELGRVDLLVEAARHVNRRVRAASAWGLTGSVDPLAVEALLRLARAPDVEVVNQALFALGWVGEPVWDEILGAGAARQQRSIRDAAGRALARSGRLVVPALIQVMQGGEAARCRVALAAVDHFLRDSALPEVVEPLLGLLRSRHPRELRREAVAVLGMTRDARAVPELLAIARESEAELRAAAATALGKIRDPAALPVLFELLQASEAVVRKAAVEALGTLGETAAARHVIEALNDPQATVRSAAAWALGELSSPDGSAELCRVLADSQKSVREAALMALWNRGEPAVLPALRARLQPEGEPDHPLRCQIRDVIRYLERRLPSAEAGAADRAPAFVGRLVPFEAGLSRVGLRASSLPCTCCGQVCHEVLEVPGDQIGRPGRTFRLIRCLDCAFFGPHYVYWESGKPVRAEFKDGQAQELLGGETEEICASLVWEPEPLSADREGWGWETTAGGAPHWLQQDETPACLACRQDMAFVLQLASATLDTIQNQGELSGKFCLILEHYATLYCFECETCGVTASVSQYT